MIGTHSKTFPTQFAIELAVGCGLFIPEDEENGREDEWYDLRDRLANFQKMSLSTDFDTAMVAYYAIAEQLSETQVNILRYIHANTNLWLKGHLASIMLENIERSSRSNNKDKSALAEMFIENFVSKEQGGGEKKKQKSMLVRFANLPPGMTLPGYEEEQEGDDTSEN